MSHGGPAMNIKMLGAHGSDLLVKEGARTRQCRSIGMLVNGVMMVDIGTGPSCLSIDQQDRIRHVVLSHVHMDHVKELPSLVDNRLERGGASLTVSSTTPVLQGLKAHVFNDHVFPNFFRLPQPTASLLREQPLEVGKETEVAGFSVTAVPVHHSVPTVGFIIREGDTACVYSGDTNSTDGLWERAARTPGLKAALIECSFPDEMQDMAQLSGHLTPSLLAQEIRKLKNPDLAIYVVHLKPQFRGRIWEQLQDLRLPKLEILEEDQEVTI